MTLPLDIQTPADARALGASAGDTSAPSSLPRSRVGTRTAPEQPNSSADVATGPGTAGSTTAGAVLEIHVVGIPAPQGSKRAFRNPHNDSVQMVESASKKLKPWRQDVKQAAIDEIAVTPGYRPPLDGVTADITFLLPRPRGHYRTGRNAHLLRDSAPARPTTKPDLDKLLRSTLDALKVAGVYTDDSNVVRIVTEKLYAVERTGAVIRIYTTTGS